MMNSPIIEFDVHGMRTEDAVAAIQKKVDQAGTAVYKIRVIHGYNGGTGSAQLSGKSSVMDGNRGKAHHNGCKGGDYGLILREL